MAKSGSEYQELVAMVAKVLDPNATINTGQWVEGPDGNREVDVEVRGTVNGESHFVLIECKDWKRPVDIQAIDALDSKRFDISADAAIIYSNSGFTKKALRKAERVGIDACSAMAAGDKRVCLVLQYETLAKRLSINSYKPTLYLSSEREPSFPEQWDFKNLRCDGLPVVNWLSAISKNWLLKYDIKQNIVYTAAFKTDTPFTLEGVTILLKGLRFDITCSCGWLSQITRYDASLGSYNHITRRLHVPPMHSLYPWTIDQRAWEEMEITDEPEGWSKPLVPDEIRINMIYTNSIAGVEGENAPPIDDLIKEQSIETPIISR